jgi:hypothetical protein
MSKKDDSIKKVGCPNSPGAYSGISIDGKKIIAGRMCCNSWNCPYCHSRLKKRLYKRIFGGALSDRRFMVKKHSLKFLTLTCPGQWYRLKYSPLEAYEQMSRAFDRLVRFLKKKYGHFHYFRVCEVQRDGYPHFHVLFAGSAIVPVGLLFDIKWSWENQSHMGFVKLNSKLKKTGFNNVKHAINYMLKYITKEIIKIGKNKRIFTCSRGALLKVDKLQYRSMLVYLGSVYPNDCSVDNFRVIDFSDQILRLPGYPFECIDSGVTIIPFDDYMKCAQQAHLNRLVGF